MADSFLWWRDGIIYQIYPRSFADSNDDGIGDLPGITAHLDHLAELGIDAIWLSPIYPSPDADFGYDVSNYVDIDPKFGTLADFDRLVEEAHRRNIHIILDLVLNHTSDQHPWFLESRKSRDNPYRDWYMWRDPAPGGGRPNNWQSVFGGPGWEFDPQTGQYYFHMFLKEQPDLNWRNPAVQDAILEVVRFWLERGTDGFRLDVFNAYFKHAEYRNNPRKLGLRGFDRQQHLYDVSQPEMFPFLKRLRDLLDQYPERYAVGETFLGDVHTAAQYCGAEKLHAAFNFIFTNQGLRPRRLENSIQAWENALGADNWPNYVLSNHDLPRAATRYAGDGNDEILKTAATMLLTLRGTPFLYYGEEIGMRDIWLPLYKVQDPPGKRFWPFFKGRDGCRSPMQWDGSPRAGFSRAKPWLPLHPGYHSRNVAAQSKDPDSLFSFYNELIQLRRSSPALQHGDFKLLPGQQDSVMAYLRSTTEETFLIGLNFSDQPQQIKLPPEAANIEWEMRLSSRRSGQPEVDSNELVLFPYEGLVLSKKR